MIKFLSKYKNDSLEKISSKKLPQLSSLHFKKTHPYTILQLLFIICWILLPRESNKIHSPPPFKRQWGTNYV